MEMIYISHPYTGNEKGNRKEAAQITKMLGKKYPYITFVNPLSVLLHLKDANLAYDTVLEQCKAVLEKCDGIIMAGDWNSSKGCVEERNLAIEHRMVIWESVEDFCADHDMPNDCCGKHHDCGCCLCRECMNRVACWNCNDCTKEPGKKPIGYTADGVWECSRCSKRSEGGD